jgi:hypothetical protein
MICEAYITSLLQFYELNDVNIPNSEQMITVWPINSDEIADDLNSKEKITDPGIDICGVAVDKYGLITAMKALKDAELAQVDTSNRGPFLLAWSPAIDKGKHDALVLTSDLSDVTTYEQAKSILIEWRRNIEQNPLLWKDGWNIEKVRVMTRLWVDKYGPKILALFSKDK